MWSPLILCIFFFFNDTATTEIYTLSLHDALPISPPMPKELMRWSPVDLAARVRRSEEHTSELQSRGQLVCRLLLEKKKNRHQVWIMETEPEWARSAEHLRRTR